MAIFSQNDAIGQFINEISRNSGIAPNLILIILVVILLWSTVWKLLGLWKSARKGSWIWFIVLALTNTVGILPILYIYVFSKMDWNKLAKKKKPSRKKISKKKITKKKKR
jgi:predicted membrane protein